MAPTTTGKWMALTAALLGWMFDGLEMGLFPLVARPAIRELIPGASREDVIAWLNIATAGFLIGAATGGVLFGWLGDRIGRVRAMALSVLTYALVTGMCAFTSEAWQVVALRFVAALGMGGEWSLGVALINEVWPDRSRAFLAGLIGAAANVGYLLVAVVSRGLQAIADPLETWLADINVSESTIRFLMDNERWRLLMILGATPAALTFFIRLFVPESQRWEEERAKGTTSHWATHDLLGVLIGAAGAAAIIYLWAVESFDLPVRLAGSFVGFTVALLGFTYPVYKYLRRAETPKTSPEHRWRPTLGRMLLAAGLAGVALLGTWASVQGMPTYAGDLAFEQEKRAILEARQSSPGELLDRLSPMEEKAAAAKSGSARELTQIFSAFGAIVGTLAAAFVGNWLGRRISYFLLCVGAAASIFFFHRFIHEFNAIFLGGVFLMGGLTASFYGWLPLYLPELFRTTVRATGQGFGFNFGRILAAIGALQSIALFRALGGFPQGSSVLAGIYLVGMIIIWLAPETKGRPLPE